MSKYVFSLPSTNCIYRQNYLEYMIFSKLTILSQGLTLCFLKTRIVSIVPYGVLYIYMHTHTHTHTHTHIYIYIYVYVWLNICAYVFMYKILLKMDLVPSYILNRKCVNYWIKHSTTEWKICWQITKVTMSFPVRWGNCKTLTCPILYQPEEM